MPTIGEAKALSPLISGTRRIRIRLVLGLAIVGAGRVGQQSLWVVPGHD
jgi:hypothetical protein